MRAAVLRAEKALATEQQLTAKLKAQLEAHCHTLRDQVRAADNQPSDVGEFTPERDNSREDACREEVIDHRSSHRHYSRRVVTATSPTTASSHVVRAGTMWFTVCAAVVAGDPNHRKDDFGVRR